MPFTPRLTSAGMNGDPWWYSPQNPFYPVWQLPNCTCYAYGRYAEARNAWAALPTGNGGDWYEAATSFQRGPTPQLGAVICFKSISGDYDGHVGIVEEIWPDGTLVTSNSEYNGAYFDLYTVTPANDYQTAWQRANRDYFCQGFIYNDVEPIPGAWGPWTLINYIRRQRKRRCGLA